MGGKPTLTTCNNREVANRYHYNGATAPRRLSPGPASASARLQLVIDKNGRAAVVLKATLNRNLKAGTPADLGVCDRGPALLMPTAGGAAVRMAPQEKNTVGEICSPNILGTPLGLKRKLHALRCTRARARHPGGVERAILVRDARPECLKVNSFFEGIFKKKKKKKKKK